MNKPVFFLAWLAAVLAAIASFNLLIGVFGLSEAIVSLVVFVIFEVYTIRRTTLSRLEENPCLGRAFCAATYQLART
jgi:hypothetical protein